MNEIGDKLRRLFSSSPKPFKGESHTLGHKPSSNSANADSHPHAPAPTRTTATAPTTATSSAAPVTRASHSSAVQQAAEARAAAAAARLTLAPRSAPPRRAEPEAVPSCPSASLPRADKVVRQRDECGGFDPFAPIIGKPSGQSLKQVPAHGRDEGPSPEGSASRSSHDRPVPMVLDASATVPLPTRTTATTTRTATTPSSSTGTGQAASSPAQPPPSLAHLGPVGHDAELAFCSVLSTGAGTETWSVLARLLGNILAHPGEDKYRTLRLGNARIRAAIVEVAGGLELLQALGFQVMFRPAVPDTTGTSAAIQGVAPTAMGTPSSAASAATASSASTSTALTAATLAQGISSGLDAGDVTRGDAPLCDVALSAVCADDAAPSHKTKGTVPDASGVVAASEPSLPLPATEEGFAVLSEESAAAHADVLRAVKALCEQHASAAASSFLAATSLPVPLAALSSRPLDAATASAPGVSTLALPPPFSPASHGQTSWAQGGQPAQLVQASAGVAAASGNTASGQGGAGKTMEGSGCHQGPAGASGLLADQGGRITDRQVRVFLPCDLDAGARVELPDAFFEASAAERLADYQQGARKREESQLLTTRAYKEQQRLARQDASRYKYSRVRVRFPDNYVLQGVFAPHEPVTAVFEWVSEHLCCPHLPFDLFLHPSRKPLSIHVEDATRGGAKGGPVASPARPRTGGGAAVAGPVLATLRDAELVPAAVINFRPSGLADHAHVHQGPSQGQAGYLREDLMRQAGVLGQSA